jgi:hypothetical protein
VSVPEDAWVFDTGPLRHFAIHGWLGVLRFDRSTGHDLSAAFAHYADRLAVGHKNLGESGCRPGVARTRGCHIVIGGAS